MICAGILYQLTNQNNLNMNDPIQFRENFMDTPTAKQLQLKKASDIGAENFEYETMVNQNTDEKIIVFYFLSKSGWVDAEVWNTKFGPNETPLMARYNHLVETRSIGVLRTNIRRNFSGMGIKGALKYIKNIGVSKKDFDAIYGENKNNKDDKNEN